MIPSAAPKDQRRRGADHPRSSPSPSRRRGCNCKKSGCLKLYCECFAANIRCGDRCQCMGCKNQEHNKLEIAHALEAIEKRTQRSSKSPIAVARKLETLRSSTPQSQHQHHASTAGQTPIRSVMDGATRLLMSAERLEEGTPYKIAMRADSDCICQPGACHPSSSCREKYGSCGPRCLCQQTPVVEKTRVPQSHEKTRGCSCKKSNCLKLYCECLAAQRVCDSRCNCEGCKNHSGHHEERERAISVILERNPMAFQPKVATGASQHLRGCNCRKSNCMKNYCECHQAGVPCTSRCACQGCRNTDAFVSAKKMLIFSGDLKANSNSTSPDGSVHSHHHATTPAVGSSKPPRRPSRRASMDITSPHMQFRTPTSQPPTGLDMLSRTAPPASQQQHAHYNVGTLNASTPIVTKRKLSELMAPQEERSFGFSSEHRKNSAGKQSTSRSSFQERLERAAVPSSPELPSVEATLDAELNAAKLDLPLSKLCRSLLNAARSVDVVPTPRKTDRSPMISRIAASPGLKGDEFKADEPENELAVASPPADDLLCEEDIETPTRPPIATANDGSGKEEDRETKRRAADLRFAAMQERAVLQEFSVWLRNLTTSAASTTFPAPSQ